MSHITRRSLMVASLMAAHVAGPPSSAPSGRPIPNDPFPRVSSAFGVLHPWLQSFAPFGATTQPSDSPSKRESLLHWRQVFFWSVVLLLIFFIAAAVIIRFSLRYRAYLFREKPPPTPNEDVWRMHRVPEQDVQEGEPRDE